MSPYTGYAKLGCRCDASLRAAARVHKRARHAFLTGQPALVDAGQARDHLVVLADAGMSRTEIERRSGVNRVTLLRVSRGELTRVARRTAAAILAVAAAPASEQRAGWVEATGTRRRLRALTVAGWPASRLAARLDTSQAHIRRLLKDGHGCSASTRARVMDLYDELWDATPPEDKPARLARRRAQMQGWLPALAWDDDEIDDPNAEPHQPIGVRGLIVELPGLVDLGLGVRGAAELLGVSPASIHRAAHRHGRPDLWRALTARSAA